MKRKLQFKSVKARMTFWFLVVALVPLLIVSGVISYQRVNAIKERKFSKLIAIRDFKVDQINSWLDERIGNIQTISEAFEIRTLEELMHKGEQQQNHTGILLTGEGLLNRYVENYKAYDELFVINPDSGKIVISTNKALIGKEKSHDPYFTEPMRIRKPYIKDIYYSQTLKEPAMAFSIPIFCTTHNEHIVGILVARVNLEDSLFELLLDRTGMGKTGETLIVNKDVIAVNQLRWHERAPLKLQISAKPASLAAQGKTGIVEAADYRGEEVLAAYTYIPRTKWGFVAKQDLKEVYAPIRFMLWNILILFAISAAIVYGLAFFLARTMARPVNEMTEVSRKIEAGDLSARNREVSADEFGFLAQSFNAMAESIESQMELREINDEITQTLVDAKDLPSFRTNILKKLVSVTGSQMGAYFVLDRDTHIFEPFTSIGVTSGLLEPFDASTLEGELGTVVETKKITRIKAIPEDSIFRLKTFTGTILPKEIISIPIIIDNVVSGIVSLASIKPYPRKVLDIMEQPWTTGFGTALSNMKANEETKRLASELVEKKYLVDSSSSAIGTSALDGIMTYVSPSFLEMWGFEDDSEVIGKPFPELWMVSEILDEVMGDLENKGTWSGEIKAKKKDGTLFHVQVSAATVYDENGKPIELMSSSIDISERKKAEKEILEINQELQAQTEELQAQSEELQQQSEELQEQNVELEAQREQVEEANRLKSEFLSNMSHELRTPLNSVMALSRVLLMQAKDRLSEEELNYLEIIQRNGQSLLSLINDILDLSKIEAGKMDVTPKLFSITSTIETIVERLQPVAEEKGLEMNQEIPDNLPQVESDEPRVHQIVQNLIGNALKFTDQGSVTVSARSDAEKIYIRVADTGIGISAKDLSHIFQEFRQVDGTSARPYEGTGLGLAIAHKAAKMLGGELTVKSVLGKGSAFTVILPMRWPGINLSSEPSALTTPEEITAAQETDIGRGPEYLKAEEVEPGNRILLVEDNEAAVIQVKTILESEGYYVDVANGGQEALEYVEKTIPDGIILDLMMPQVDGFEVLGKLRSSKATALIPVLVLTAKDLTPEDLDKLTANNIQQLVQKGDVDREGLLFRTRLMLGTEARLKFETGNLKLETEDLKLETKDPGQAARGTAGKPVTILIVKDNPDNMTTIKAILQNKYTILEATDGEEGLKIALSELPDLILLDMSLPKLDGFEVVGKIKADEKARNIPVIALTARAMKGDRERTIDAGCDDYVSKPVDPEKLMGKIGYWVKS